jgi:hypothetical protein
MWNNDPLTHLDHLASRFVQKPLRSWRTWYGSKDLRDTSLVGRNFPVYFVAPTAVIQFWAVSSMFRLRIEQLHKYPAPVIEHSYGKWPHLDLFGFIFYLSKVVMFNSKLWNSHIRSIWYKFDPPVIDHFPSYKPPFNFNLYSSGISQRCLNPLAPGIPSNFSKPRELCSSGVPDLKPVRPSGYHGDMT